MNRSNPAIKRIFADVKELQAHASTRYTAAPLEDNLFEWHFTIRGPVGTDFEGGLYHGRILLPSEYPFKPPNIVFLTKNGRFEVGTKICLSISAYHPEHWQPAWGVRTMLEAIISFLPTEGAGAIGALDWSPKERKDLAIESHKYKCPTCGDIVNILPAYDESECVSSDPDMAAQISQLHLHGIGPTSPDKSSTKKPGAGEKETEATRSDGELQSSVDNASINKKVSSIDSDEKQITPPIIVHAESKIGLEAAMVSEIDSSDPLLRVPLCSSCNLNSYKAESIEPRIDEAVVKYKIDVGEQATDSVGDNNSARAASGSVPTVVAVERIPTVVAVERIPTVVAVERPQPPRVRAAPPEKDLVDTLLLIALIILGTIIAVLISKRAMHMYQMVYGDNSPDSTSYSQQNEGHVQSSFPAEAEL